MGHTTFLWHGFREIIYGVDKIEVFETHFSNMFGSKGLKLLTASWKLTQTTRFTHCSAVCCNCPAVANSTTTDTFCWKSPIDRVTLEAITPGAKEATVPLMSLDSWKVQPFNHWLFREEMYDSRTNLRSWVLQLKHKVPLKVPSSEFLCLQSTSSAPITAQA